MLVCIFCMWKSWVWNNPPVCLCMFGLCDYCMVLTMLLSRLHEQPCGLSAEDSALENCPKTAETSMCLFTRLCVCCLLSFPSHWTATVVSESLALLLFIFIRRQHPCCHDGMVLYQPAAPCNIYSYAKCTAVIFDFVFFSHQHCPSILHEKWLDIMALKTRSTSMSWSIEVVETIIGASFLISYQKYCCKCSQTKCHSFVELTTVSVCSVIRCTEPDNCVNNG